MTTQLQPDRDTEQADGDSRRKRLVLSAVIAVLVLLAMAAVLFIARDDDTTTTTPSTTASSAPSITAATVQPTSPSVVPSTSTSAPVTVPTDASTAVWPAATSATRYDTPADAATGFAVDFLGFVDPVVSPFMQGDGRSGEVEIRPNATGPVTTVFVRQLGQAGVDDSWWVLGSATDNIRIDDPSALDRVSSPVHVSGTSTAFEAQVNVRVNADGQQSPLATTYVMGGANGEFGPFSADVDFRSPNASGGSIVMFTQSMENGQTWEASVVRVQFAQ